MLPDDLFRADTALAFGVSFVLHLAMGPARDPGKSIAFSILFVALFLALKHIAIDGWLRRTRAPCESNFREGLTEESGR